MGLSVLAGGSGEPSHPYVEQVVKTCHEFGFYGRVEEAGCFTRVDTGELASSPASEIDLTGDAAIMIGDSDKAIAQFDRAIRADPRDAHAYVGRGLAFVEKSDFDRAISEFDHAAELDPHDSAALVDRGNAYLTKEKHDQALQDYTRAIAENPRDPFAYNQRGVVYGYKGDAARARADLGAAIAIEPNISVFYFNRVLADNLADDYVQGIADLERVRALDEDPNELAEKFSREVSLLARSFDCRTQYDKAAAAYAWLSKLDPDRPFDLEFRAECHSAHGNYDLAVQDYDRVIGGKAVESYLIFKRAEAEDQAGEDDRAFADYNYALTRKDESLSDEYRFIALFNRGRFYLKKGQYTDATADFAAALKIKPDDVPALIAQGQAFSSLGDTVQASQSFDTAVRRGSENAAAFVARGNFNQGIKNYVAAIADYDRAISLDANNNRAFNNRCFVRAVSNTNLEIGLADCNQALKLKPNDAGALSNQGLVLLRLGQFNDAVASYDAALAANPRASWALYGRGLARLKMGDAGGSADLSAAKAADDNVAAAFAAMGLAPA